MSYDAKLHSRFHNCLNTLFELEVALGKSDIAEFMRPEFVELKEVSEQIELSDLSESDVELIEKATERLLHELYQIGTNVNCDFSQNWNIH